MLTWRTRSAPAVERGVEDVDRPPVVHRVELAAVAGPEVRVGRQVIDEPAARDGPPSRLAVADVGADDLDPAGQVRRRRPPAARRRRTRSPRLDEQVDQVAADEPGAAGHDRHRVHAIPPLDRRPDLASRPDLVEFLREPGSRRRLEHARRRPAGRRRSGVTNGGEPVIARRAIALDLEPVDVDVGRPRACRSASPDLARATGPGRSSRSSRRRRPCCRRSAGSGGRPPPGRRAGPSPPAAARRRAGRAGG